MPPRTDHTLLVHGHSGTFQFYYVRKKAFVIGVGVSCDLLIDTKVLATAFKRTRFCIIERRGNPQETYIKVSDGIPVQVNGKVPVPNQHHTLPNGAYLTLPTTPDDAPVKGSSISLQYWNIAPGSVFEAFRLENCIGQGGFGAVYRAVHKSSKSEYAIKIVRKARQLPLHYDQDPVDREIAILKDITHPAVVHLHNVYNERHTYFLVMELMPEGSLQDLLKDERRIVESDAKLAIIDVCAALTYLHAKGIMHRDIKPGNILVRSRNPLSVKLADFGIAKMLDQHTYFQTMCGTPDFMAPEITRMEKYDFKVDTWALGVTLFMLLSGHSPFPRDRGTACLDNINAETPAIRWDRLPKDSAQPRQRQQLISAMLMIKALGRPTVSTIPRYAWFQDAPPPEFLSCAAAHPHPPTAASDVARPTGPPRPRPVHAPSRALEYSRQRPAPSSVPKAEVRSASFSASQRERGAERGPEVKRVLWSLTLFAIFAFLYRNHPKDMFL